LKELLLIQALCGNFGVPTALKLTQKWSGFKISGGTDPKTLGLSEMADNVRLMDLVRKLRFQGVGL
jgi:hypothetical protein